ncbi:YfiR family protein [Massilia forsythiae]|uniref:YfiR family protein n=1 Tax=Massilia forsythiae TaxID=2728020 RepID=A0A7Z2W1K6_9BURK|nr:YfiR family protein [Massilia forsythiae]QJE02720.1 YfiR family protein [Massilia forsythiae]
MPRPSTSIPALAMRRRLVRWGVATVKVWAVACVCAGAALAATPRAQAYPPGTGAAGERRVKAAFVVKFLTYADFPAGAFADAASPVTIGVVGADEMALELAHAVAGRSVNSRTIVVRPLHESEVHAPLHLLFIGGQDPVRVARIMRQASTGTLLVTEYEQGLPQGSVINFRIVDGRVRFDVSLDAAERNGIKLSSRLLAVASRVQKGTQ